MKTLCLLLGILSVVAIPSDAAKPRYKRPTAQNGVKRDVRVRPYVKKNGAVVFPHYKKSPNKTQFDNYGTKGNVNPYTGKKGKVKPVK